MIMARLILLDSGPLGLIVRAPNKPQVVRCLAWLNTISATGATVVIPEIAHYEVRRGLSRIRAVGSLRRLEYCLDPSGGLIHLTVSTDAMIKAAEFWPFSDSPACRRHRQMRWMPMPSSPPGVPRRSAWRCRNHRHGEPGSLESISGHRRPELGSDSVTFGVLPRSHAGLLDKIGPKSR